MLEKVHITLMKNKGVTFKKNVYKFNGQRLATIDGDIIRVYNQFGNMDSLINMNHTSYEVLLDTIERNLLRFIEI